MESFRWGLQVLLVRCAKRDVRVFELEEAVVDVGKYAAIAAGGHPEENTAVSAFRFWKGS